MLEAVTTDPVFTISLKRSTQNLQLSTTWAGRLPPNLERITDLSRTLGHVRFMHVQTLPLRKASSLTNEKPPCRLLTAVSASGTLQCNEIRVSPLGLTVRRTISFLRSFGCIGNE
jgi:hypothetical protein